MKYFALILTLCFVSIPAKADCSNASLKFGYVGDTSWWSWDMETALKIRLDSAKFEKELPDTYVISIKDGHTGDVVASNVTLTQGQPFRLKTKCGDTTILARRISGTETMQIDLSFF